MSKKLRLFAKITSIILWIFLAQISTSFAQRNPRNTVAGEKTYIARPMPYDNLVSIGNVDAAVKAGTAHIKGFAAAGTTGLITCVTQSGREVEKVRYVYRLFLDEESLESSLTTNQRSKTAKIKLVGNMRVWEQEFIKNDPNCRVDFKEINGGRGGLDITMRNKRHVTPLNFMAGSASGRVYGPVMNDSLSIASGSNPPTYINSVDTGFVKKLIPKQNQQLSPEALRRMGINLPPGALEQLKQNQNIAKSNAPDHRVDGILKGVSKDKAIAFQFTTGFQADMLVYKPKAMSGSGGSAKFDDVKNYKSFSNKSVFQKVGFSRNSESSSLYLTRVSGNTNAFIPRQDRDKVQAFVNLDNDDKDDKFDNEDDDVKGGDNDLVKVVLRTKLTKSFTAKAVLDFHKDSKNNKSVKIYRTEDKTQEYKPGTELSVTRDFIQSGNGFRKRTLWIEGIEAHTKQRDVKLEFKFWETDDTSKEPTEKDDFDLTVIGVESIEWKGRGNSIDGNDILDADINHRNPSDQFTNSDATLNGRTFPEKCGGKVTSTLTEPEAVRVFPGKRVKNGNVSQSENDQVRAIVKLSVAPPAPLDVYLRSFDVDDPSASNVTFQQTAVVDTETSADDNRGKTKANNSGAGFFVGKPVADVVSHEFTRQEETIYFQVTKQPGDNFRIVAGGDEEFLRNLENDDSKLNIGSSESIRNGNKQRIVDKNVFNANSQDAKKAEIREQEKYASKTLTVWRFVYNEVDYMNEITEDKIRGTIEKVERNTPNPGQSNITLQANLTTEYKKIAKNVSKFGNSNGIKNAFQEGEIRIRGGTYKILYNSANEDGYISTTNDHVIVDGLVPEVKKGTTTFFLWDDDVKWGFKKGTKLRESNIRGINRSPNWSPIEEGDACTVAERYLPAYIVPDFKSLIPGNRTKEVDFVRNVYGKQISPKDDLYETKKYYEFDYSNYDKDEDFWTVYLLYGYRGATYEDGDPDGGSFGNIIPTLNKEGAIEGITDLDKTGIMVFFEGVVERNGGYMLYNGFTGEEDCVAHEIGQIFGAEHGDNGLMGDADGVQNATVFSDVSLNKIRSAKHP